jgi:TonB-linked SusC/RagA family outer membrane protein
MINNSINYKNMNLNLCGKSPHRKYLTSKIIVSMKLTVIIVIASCMHLSAAVFSQTINIAEKNVPMEKVLKSIQEQSGYEFFYDNKQIRQAGIVSIKLVNVSVNQALNELFKDQPFSYTIDNRTIIIRKKEEEHLVVIPAPVVISISGSIIDELGQPLPGVIIREKGTNHMAIADQNGYFSMKVADENAILTFSFIGFVTQEVKVAGQTSLIVTLKQSIGSLSEVVVVGYGEQKKVNLTGAVSQVDGKIFLDKPVANIAQSLQGVIPNLNVTFSDGHPGSSGTFNIRGTNSINSSGPLILIDGVPGNIDMINPSDVASISVLKDAASAAIYGARGAFGVILVTTKQGKPGKLIVNYNSSYGIQKQTTRTDFITDGFTMDSLVDVSFSRHNGSSYTKYTDADYAELKKRQKDKSLPSVVIQNRNGVDQYIYYGSTDWYHFLFQKSQPSLSQNLSLSGGSDKVTFLISGRAFEQKGMYQPYLNTDVFHSYNFRAKINAKINNWMSVYSNTQFSANNYTWPGYGINSNFFNFAVHALASYVPQNPDGTYPVKTNLNNYDIGNGIFADLQQGKTLGGNRNYDISNTFGFNINASKSLEFSGNYTFELMPYSDFQRRTLIPYSIFPGVISTQGTDQLNQNTHLDNQHTVNLYGTYSHAIDKHHIKLMSGFNQEIKTYTSNSGMRQNLLSQDLNQLSLGTGLQQSDGYSGKWALLGFFGRANYDYDNKYLVEFNGRYDGTSRFRPDKRFGLFPSLSAGWRVSQESFFSPLNHIISELKIRGSYGTLGNQDPGSSSSSANLYPYIPIINNGLSNWINNGNQTQTLRSPNPITPDFTWEKSATTDFGADINFFKNKLQVSYDRYTRKTTDILINGKTLPAVFGAGSPKQNAGDLETKGFDLSVLWNSKLQLASKDFSYHIGVVLSDFKSKITKFDNPTNQLSNYYVGQQIGEIWGYSIGGYFKTDAEAQSYPINQTMVNKQILGSPGEWKSLHAGDIKYLDLNGDGIINNGQNTLDNHGDLRRIGNVLPRYSYGITGGFNWNNIDLSFAFQGIGKQNWFPGREAGMFWGPYSRPYFSFIPKDMPSQMWSPSNPDAYFPLLRGYEAYSGGGELHSTNDKYLQNLAYIRLKNLTLGYALPSRLVQHVNLQKVRVYFSGQNLLTFTKLKNKYIDPEQVASGSADDTNGNDYPFFKNYAFGIAITF